VSAGRELIGKRIELKLPGPCAVFSVATKHRSDRVGIAFRIEEAHVEGTTVVVDRFSLLSVSVSPIPHQNEPS